jgi:heterodisulfide reductase subunit C
MEKTTELIVKEGNGFACIQSGDARGPVLLEENVGFEHAASYTWPSSAWKCTSVTSVGLHDLLYLPGRCPKEVKITDIIIELRNLAVKNSFYPTMADVPKIIIQNLYRTGNGQPLSPEVSKLRSIIGLDKEPNDIAKDKAALADFQKLLDGLPLMRWGGI